MAEQFVLGYNLVMQRSAALLALFVCVGCNSPAAPAPEVTQAVSAQSAPAHTVQAAPPSEPVAAASCGGEGHGSCCSGGAEGTCGQGSSCGGSSCGAGTHDALPGSSEDTTAALTRIQDPSQVCMVRNHFMGRPQLAIQADGSTYYGCCAGCANRLLQDARARTAIDPISHRQVDKGLAVLARNPRGAVLYFENESNLEMFRATMQ